MSEVITDHADWKCPVEIEKGMYDDAEAAHQDFGGFLEAMRHKDGDIKGDGSPYVGLSQRERIEKKWALEKAMAGERPLEAGEAHMRAVGIATKEWTLEKLLTSDPGNRTLTPWIVETFAAEGAILGSLIRTLAMRVITVPVAEAMRKFDRLEVVMTEAQRQLRRTGEGAIYPETAITSSETQGQMMKHGRVIKITDEARSKTLDELGIAVRQIFDQVGVDETDDAFDTLRNGDGNSNALANVVPSITSPNVTAADVLALWAGLTKPLTVTDIFFKKAMGMTYYGTLFPPAATRDATAALQRTPYPRPAEHEWDRPTLIADRILGIDQNRALIHRESDLTTEGDRLIDRDVERTKIRKFTGNQIWDPTARVELDVTHA